MDFLRQLYEGMLQAWQRLSSSARVNVAMAGLFAAIVIGYLVYVGGQPQYVTLFEDIEPDDMVAVQSAVESEGVPYKVDSAGRSIQVPVNERSGLRVRLLAEGIPKSQGTLPGFESLRDSSVMQNQFVQEKGYQIALMGQLQRMLNEFDFVDRSFVQITPAEESLFSAEQKPAEATVSLKVTRSLSEEDVKAVLGMISSFGGANLTRDHIHLVTVDGKVLNAPSEDDFDSIANSKLTYMKNYQRTLEKHAEEKLAQIGIRSVVTVSLEIDNSATTETTETVAKGQTVSRYSITNSTETSEGAPSGPAGARQNLPTDVGAEPGGNRTTQQEEQTLENTVPSTTKIEKITTPGDVVVSSVTAIVEGRYTDAVDENGQATGVKDYVARTKQELDAYKQLVASATGVAGDSIHVSDHAFELEQLAAATMPAAAPSSGAMSGVLQWLPMVGRLALVLIAFLLVRYFLVRATVRGVVEEEDIEIQLPKAGPEELRRREIASEVERVSVEQPEQVASLLRTWLSESSE